MMEKLCFVILASAWVLVGLAAAGCSDSDTQPFGSLMGDGDGEYEEEESDTGEADSPAASDGRPLDGDAEEPAPPPSCPDDMILIEEEFCIDIHEASRPDATEDDPGKDSSKALSRAGVIPWTDISQLDAQTACAAAGKRLCYASEWLAACQGPDHGVYSYGDEYEPAACNGIDAFCETPVEGCGIEELSFKLVPTGVFPDCTNGYGLFDMNGNVAEWDANPLGHSRGGSYNASDSKTMHRCDSSKIENRQGLPNIGFRCCKQ